MQRIVRPSRIPWIYAQAQELIDQDEPYWFDDHETQLIMRHNRQFQLKSPAEQYFTELFDVAAEDDAKGQWLTAAAIFQRIRKAAGSTLKQSNMISFGRMLANIEGMQRHRTVNGMEYWVRPK